MSRMPVLFVGHGSPMNAIEKNQYSDTWQKIGRQLPKPKAILSVSAHWFTPATLVADTPAPKMVYDMYGFPEELYRVQYPAPGSPEFAGAVKTLLGDKVQIDNTWGLDHGTWSVLRWLFPGADVPVFQLSVHRHIGMKEHFTIGRALHTLREQGVLILGSGNVVHNLRKVNPGMTGGYRWAEEFDDYIKQSVQDKRFDDVVHYERAGDIASDAFYFPDHFAPLLYVLGASDDNDTVTVFNDTCVMGSLSMTGYLFSGE